MSASFTKMGFERKELCLVWGILRITYISFGFMLVLGGRKPSRVAALHGTGLHTPCVWEVDGQAGTKEWSFNCQ